MLRVPEPILEPGAPSTPRVGVPPLAPLPIDAEFAPPAAPQVHAPPAPLLLPNRPRFLAIVAGFYPVIELRKLMVSFALVNSSVKSLTCLLSSEICYVFGSSFLIGLFAIQEAFEA